MLNNEPMPNLELHEDKETEFKITLDADENKIEKWAKTLVGFSNSYGGYILVGINDNGDFIGLKKTKSTNAKI